MKSRVLKRLFPLAMAALMLPILLLPCVAVEPISTEPVTVERSVVSHGLGVLSAKTDVALSAMAGNDLILSPDAFAKGMNLSAVTSVKVITVPPITDGELLLGSSKVVAGQLLTAEQLKSTVFHPATDAVIRTSFSFSANNTATPMVCNLYFLKEENHTPTVSMASSLSLNVSTYRGISAYGHLSAFEPDGDDLFFEVISYPQNGTVTLTDATLGSYVYTPMEGYVGSDSFSYVARDKYGNYSASAKVSLQVEISGTSVTYADMKGSETYAAALKLTDAGIMSGTQVGKDYYFYPENKISRIEFLVMAMNSAGITDVPDCSATAFADDGEIPTAMKGYVAVAHTMGIVSGSQVEGELRFLPNESLTRAEAAVLLERLLGLEEARVIPTFADHSEIPVWAADAVYSLHAVGILMPNDGYIGAPQAVTRAQAAGLLAAVMTYCD